MNNFSTAPIYLLVDGETDGPHSVYDIESWIGDGEVSPDTLASIEGMKEWRVIGETMLWAVAPLLQYDLAQAEDLARQIADHKIERRDLPIKLQAILRKHGQNPSSEMLESLSMVVDANGLLLRNHRYYTARDQFWNKDAMEFAPAFQLLPFGVQKFSRDWPAVWQAAGGKLSTGKMIARKDDAVWITISDFGFPFPPFSFDPMIWFEDVFSDQAEAAGIFGINAPINLPEVAPFKLVGVTP